jgi:uncharacterized membrane protein YfcA
MPSFLLALTGLVAGFVDSIAGGGGLITLPALTLLFGPGASVIGTNKIAGCMAAAMALVVYARKGHFDFKRSLAFTLWISIGSYLGSQISPLLPAPLFHWFLVITCPIILWIVFRKDLWVRSENVVSTPLKSTKWLGLLEPGIFVSGILCGIYDGAWGPGAGTLMLLSLIFFARLPLFIALAASKLANACSAAVALASYASKGYVHWPEGICLAIGISLGAVVGAQCATQNASRIVRPVLASVVCLLLAKLVVFQ